MVKADLIGKNYMGFVIAHVTENNGEVFDVEKFPFLVADGHGRFEPHDGKGHLDEMAG